MFGIWDVRYVKFYGRGMLNEMWNAGIGDVGDVGYSGCTMSRMWDVWDVG